MCDVFSLAISNWSVGFCFEKFFELEHSRKKNFKVLFERWFYFVMFLNMLITHKFEPFNGDNYVTKN